MLHFSPLTVHLSLVDLKTRNAKQKLLRRNSMGINVVEMYEKEHMKRDIPDTPIGSTVKVHYRIIEGEKERIQIFEGIVIARKRAGLRSSITVRKVTAGIGVERVFPLHSPKLDRIQVTRLGRVRRSKLYYLRALRGKKARIREKDQY
jgi:large subunit ribosomal protein L19